jgi:hypothetical protein
MPPASTAPPARFRRWLAPTLLDVFFATLLIAAFALPQGARGLLSDGDTGWHIRTGELVLNTGRVPVSDPFSFTRPGQPWFAWEWLADVCFALMWRWRGMAAVAGLAGALLALTATTLLARVLHRGCGLWISVAATMAAVSASSIHFLARPHIFSILCYTVALWLLAEDRERPARRLWLLVPLTAIWTNLHAGFVAWLATLGLLLLVCAAQRDWVGLRRYTILAALCSSASLLNPYGWQLHLHIAQYLNSPWILDHVQEFQSPAIRSEGMIVYALLLLAALSLAWKADPFERLLVLVWAFASLRSARHIPFFAITAAPLVASACAAYWHDAASRAVKASPVHVFWYLALDLGRSAGVSLWLPISAAIVLVTASNSSFPATVFPVRAVESNLGQLAPGREMPRVLTSDQWADYLIFRLYPRQRVFFDGRSDFFGPQIGSDYRKLLAGEDSSVELLDQYGFEFALLPRDWPLRTMLERQPGWHRIYQDAVAVLYARDGGGQPLADVPSGGS